MLENIGSTSLPLANLVFRGTVIYLTVLILIRLSGKRQMGQMSATEFVAILLISNAVQNAMNGGDNSLVGGLVLAVVLIFLSWLISLLTYRSKKFALIFEGSPTLVVHKGQIVKKALHRERITANELKALLRKQGIHSHHDIESAILEADGTLSVTKTSEDQEQKPA